ncbi:MAG TPA: cyclase family protein [Gemmatimonadaceae bacterium]|nr:cyclase family protein [Gemmatimonadaceae bacterium]
MRRIIDISTPLVNGGLVYPGNPPITITSQQSIADGASANVSSIVFGSHTGTHVDAAKHFFDDGETVDQLPLDRLIGRAVVLEFADDVMRVGAKELEGQRFDGATRVLLKTRNSALLEQAEFARDYTFLAPDGAELLVEKGVELVGIDYLSIEQFKSGHHRTHRTLLERRIVIVEGLQLGGVAPGAYDFICLPLRLAGMDGAPARAVLVEIE